MSDIEWMREALRVAERGFGKVSPNPLVGAVLVKDDMLLSSGAHLKFGGPHAEVMALRKVGKAAQGATLYVTLEPCNHVGKTPPCTDSIIRAGVKRVVVAATDPNPMMAGRSYEILRNAGIEVTTGVLESEARSINRAYFKHSVDGLPHVIVKIAQSLDGKIATSTGSSQWITGEKSRKFVHQLRASVDAVVVGIGTVLADDPLLNVRMVKGRDPLRIVVDSHYRTPANASMFSTPAKVMICGVRGEAIDRQLALKGAGADVIELPSCGDHVSLRAILQHAASIGVRKILVEGGRDIATAFLGERLVDELIIAIAPKLIGADGRDGFGMLGISKIDDAIALERIHIERYGDDVHLRMLVR